MKLNELPKQPIKLLIVGDPGSGKTGSLASLVNVLGLKLRVACFDGNIRPLIDYVEPDKRELVDVHTFSDRMRVDGTGHISFSGSPSSPAEFARLLDNWDGDGAVDTWGLDTVLVIDPLSHLTELKLRESAGGGSPEISDYQNLKDEILALLWFLKRHVTCHVVCIDHLTVPSERIDMRSRQERMASTPLPADTFRSEQAWRRYPFAAGRALPPILGGFFDLILHARAIGSGRAARRVLSLTPAPDVDTKAPVQLFGGKTELPVEDGLATFFTVLMKEERENE